MVAVRGSGISVRLHWIPIPQLVSSDGVPEIEVWCDEGMKIRIGFGLGTSGVTSSHSRFAELVDGLEGHGFDSLWLSERVTGDCPDPLVAMSFAIARTQKLKVGMSVMVLPGRNPVVLAKSLASLDRLSDGRLLPAFGLGAPNSAEHQAFGVDRGDRSAWFNEALPLMRRLWTEDDVSHSGERFVMSGVTVRPKPVQRPLEVWLGGQAPSELRRIGRLADGWLASFVTPDRAEAGCAAIDAEADANGRTIDRDHFGALIVYRRHSELPEQLVSRLRQRNPDLDLAEVMPTVDNLAALISAYISCGLSKFVLVPAFEPESWEHELADIGPLARSLEN